MEVTMKRLYASLRLPVMLVALLLLAVGVGNSAVITFGPLAGPGDAPYGGHAEAGFTVTPAGGAWFEAHAYGNPVPSVYAGPIGAPGVSTLEVVDSTLPFVFSSLDYSSNNGVSDYQIQGFLGAALVFNQVGVLAASLPPAFGFNNLASANPGAVIDLLVITVTPGAGVTSINIDNIDVSKVPEPGALVLLSAGGLFLLFKRVRS
jgi:hypothetical protein